MPKNAVKETTNSNPVTELPEPYSEKTSLGGPIPKIGSHGVMPCRVQLSSKTLAAAGMKPRDQVQVISEAGQIIIKKTGEPSPGFPIPQSKPRPELDEFLEYIKKRAKGPDGWEDEEESEESEESEEEEAGLSAEQLDKEEL